MENLKSNKLLEASRAGFLINFFFHYKCRSSNGGIQCSLISQKGAMR